MGKVHIISRSQEAFSDRKGAGRLLGKELKRFQKERPIVLGIPRGGVVVAKELAEELKADLDIVLCRKLGAPNNPEFAIGAITEEGKIFLNELVPQLSALDEYIQQEKEEKLREIKQRIERYRKIKPKLDLKEKIVIITDDGIATGATMQAAVWAIRQENPAKIIVALPVSPQDSINRISKDADEIIVLRVPSFFGAVGQFYANFEQTKDEEVLGILKKNEI